MRHTIVFIAVTAGMLFPGQVISAVLTVAKNGSGQFISVQAAVDAAAPGDEIVISDTAVYEEQVTIDSTKNGLVLRSENPMNLTKPVLRYKDTLNIKPTTKDEALDEATITFDRNGAVRIIGASGIRIEGICIDGGGVFPFGSKAVWEGRFDMQHGNAALVLLMAGEVLVRYCDLENAYFGIYCHDRNVGGIYATLNPSDAAVHTIFPFSGVFRTGNHLIEHNRIHNNSMGVFFESVWDMGSTIRYNLIYENHHPTSQIAELVKNLTPSDGESQSGGAFMFKDQLLSPLAIYNNTLWHNSVPFLGNWKAGGQHLIFNNIIASPNEYIIDRKTTFASSFEMSKAFENRMHNTVWAAQQQAPTANYTTITNDLIPVHTGGSYAPGALITPFPSSAEVRWLETKFLSTDPTDENFLVPDWGDELVQEYIVDKGWEEAGVRDPDGSRADIGAVPMGGGRWVDVVTIQPAGLIEMDGATARIPFNVLPQTGTMADLKVVMSGLVTDLDTSDVFGAEYDPVPPLAIQKIALGAQQPVSMGYNVLEVPVGTLGDFAFFEMVIEGTGSNGLPVATPVGFIPYRKVEGVALHVILLDKAGGSPIDSIMVGETVVIRIRALQGDSLYPLLIDEKYTTVGLLASGTVLETPEGEPMVTVPGGIHGETEVEAVFTEVPPGGVTVVHVSATGFDEYRALPILGVSDGITIYPDPTSVAGASAAKIVSTGHMVVEMVDLKGRVVQRLNGKKTMSGKIHTAFPGTGAGVVLVKMRSSETGRTTVKRRVLTGR